MNCGVIWLVFVCYNLVIYVLILINVKVIKVNEFRELIK